MISSFVLQPPQQLGRSSFRSETCERARFEFHGVTLCPLRLEVVLRVPWVVVARGPEALNSQSTVVMSNSDTA